MEEFTLCLDTCVSLNPYYAGQTHMCVCVFHGIVFVFPLDSSQLELRKHSPPTHLSVEVKTRTFPLYRFKTATLVCRLLQSASPTCGEERTSYQTPLNKSGNFSASYYL